MGPGGREDSRKARTLKRAASDAIPVITGYLVLGVAFGVLLRDAGFGIFWALAMSCLVYAGSLQFVLIPLMTGGASLLSAAMISFLVNARHLLYGISMLLRYRDMGRAKPYLIFSLTDETYALVCGGAPEGTDEKLYFLLVSVIDQSAWVAGSLLGCALGAVLPFDSAGIDFAMTALFIVILTDQVLTAGNRLPAAAGIFLSLACLLIFGPDAFLIPSMALICGTLTALGAYKGRRGKEET
ncbi:MAG: AzlC family ABC transporter permease [Lachnospiraceae bacterium]|nr:AzlC family ABC transporter permease [Lachnospiraceae bacterium]